MSPYLSIFCTFLSDLRLSLRLFLNYLSLCLSTFLALCLYICLPLYLSHCTCLPVLFMSVPVYTCLSPCMSILPPCLSDLPISLSAVQKQIAVPHSLLVSMFTCLSPTNYQPSYLSVCRHVFLITCLTSVYLVNICVCVSVCLCVAWLFSGHAWFSGWLLEILMYSSCRGNIICSRPR